MHTTQPTILQIVPELDTGGAELSTIEIASAIVDAGGRALVVSEGGRMASRVEAAGGEFIPFAAATKNPVRILHNARKLRRLIADEHVDLVHARSRAPAWSSYLAVKNSKIAFVTTYHGAYSEKSLLKKRYNQVMASGQITIANSKYTADLIQSRYGTPDKQLRVIYRGLDGTQFDPSAITDERRAQLRTAWNIDPNQRVILLVARLSPIKGQMVVVDAVAELASSGLLDNSVVIFAGDAQGREGYVQLLEQRIAHHGLENKIRMVGHVEDVPAALSLTHTALFASTKPETFGRTAIEAQAMACPVIATNIGAPPETVRATPHVSADEVTGWLVPPGDPESFAAAMTEALGLTEAERTALGQRARQHVLKNFSLDTMRQQTLDVYDTVLGTSLSKSRAAR